MAEPAGKIAWVAGGSGLVGSKLLPLLIDAGDYTRVLALSRRPLPHGHPRMANRIVRFDIPLDRQLAGMQCQDAYCCMGTTLRDAGSQEGFRAVDHDMVLQFARTALAAGAQRFIVISSLGASESSRSFYLRVKGQTERALTVMAFRALDILQPSVLIGARRGWRPLEFLAQGALWTFNPLLLGETARFRGIAAQTVAAAMLGAARSGRLGMHRYTYRQILALASGAERDRARL
jgi:uncharacterized protein YbjT (DUF2867 family)